MLHFPRPGLTANTPRAPLRAAIAIAAATAISAAGSVLLAAVAAAPAVAAETRLQAKYGVSLAGFPVAKAYLTYTLNGKGYTVTGSARTTGIVRLISDGRGEVSAKGRLVGARPVPAAYSYNVADEHGRETLTMAFSGNRVRRIKLIPPENPEKLKRRVPLKRAHKVGVLDPLSALFIPAAADKVCDRTLPIFDGEQRFDLVLSRKRADRFRGGRKNFKGRVVVCAVAYRPIAGHRADKKEVEYMRRNGGMEIWMAPVGDSGVMAPVSARLNTKIGPMVIRARRFILH